MLLTCPHCETIFRVDTTDLKSEGRYVRCSICSHVWLAKHRQIDLLTQEEKQTNLWNQSKFKLLLILLMVILSIVAVTSRNFIAAQVESTQPFYQALGLHLTPALEKIEILRLRATRQRDTVRISGSVSNRAKWKILAPPLLARVTNQAGEILAEKNFRLNQSTIPASASVAFSTQIILPHPLKDDELTEITITPLTKVPEE